MTETGSISEDETGCLVLRFLGALIAGPVIAAVVTYLGAMPVAFVLGLLEIDPRLWSVLLAPSMGLIFGLPYYLTAGTLAFIICIGRGRTRIGDFAQAAFVANLASPVLSLPVCQDGEYALMLLLYGSVAAPAWGAGFGLVYRWLGGGVR